MFLNDMEGTLMEMIESAESRFKYIIWFDYTRQAINKLQEGTLLAVPNFASEQNQIRYSILEVGSILPTHYAIEGGTRGYPGFVVEAARSAAEDWETQENTSTEDTTKIKLEAIPTNLEIIECINEAVKIDQETNIAMVGSKVKVLNTDFTNLVANNGIDEENEENLTIIGTMTRDENVQVLLRIEELLRTHFAIFGFTGVGKSNLLSTLVFKVLNDSKVPVKIVFFDLMSEYTTLLIDQLLNKSINGKILTIGRRTLPEGLFKYINELEDAPHIDEATKQLNRYNLLPKALVKDKELIIQALNDLIINNNILYFNEQQSISIYDFFFTEDTVNWAKRRQAEKKSKRKGIIIETLKKIQIFNNYEKQYFNPKLASDLKKALKSELEKDNNKEFVEDFENHFKKLNELEKTTSETLKAGITLKEIVSDLNDNSKSSLLIIQAHNPSELRTFAKKLGEEIYENRRKTGTIDPLAVFIFDEADEFIKREAPEKSYEDSAYIAQTLARRGRKFGLGLGIATQRIRYLDTNIMSQPHTYFVSKLPRISDRDVVAEAFGIGPDILTQTFRFKKGQWLLMSHGATGLEAIPLPIQAPNANERISNWMIDKYRK